MFTLLSVHTVHKVTSSVCAPFAFCRDWSITLKWNFTHKYDFVFYDTSPPLKLSGGGFYAIHFFFYHLVSFLQPHLVKYDKCSMVSCMQTHSAGLKDLEEPSTETSMSLPVYGTWQSWTKCLRARRLFAWFHASADMLLNSARSQP